MKCPNCGAKVYSNERYCSYCHSEMIRSSDNKQIDSSYQEKYDPTHGQTSSSSTKDDGSLMWGILGFFFPLIGLILFFLWNTSRPKSAQKAILGALLGFIFYVVNVNIFRHFHF